MGGGGVKSFLYIVFIEINIMSAMDFDSDSDESENGEDDGEIEEIIAEVEDECSLVMANSKNADLLERLFEMARNNYEKDRKGWKSFFSELKSELISTDDEDNSHEILDHYLRKAKLELI